MRFADALAAPGFGAIAEFKRRSPSLGDIRPDARVEEIVPAYAGAGASAISVLVDARFAGSLDDLRAARAVTGIPVCRKRARASDGEQSVREQTPRRAPVSGAERDA